MVLKSHMRQSFTPSARPEMNQPVRPATQIAARYTQHHKDSRFGNEIITSSSPAPASNPAPAPAPAQPLSRPDFVSAFTLQRLWILKKQRQAIRLRLFSTAPMHDKKKAVIAHSRSPPAWPLADRESVDLSPGIPCKSEFNLSQLKLRMKSIPLNAIYLPVRPMYFGPSYGMKFRIDNSFTGGTFFFDNAHIRPKDLDSDWVTVAPARAKGEKEKK